MNERCSKNKQCSVLILNLIIFFISPSIFSQSVLDALVAKGLKNNVALGSRHLELEKSLYALKEAKSLFGPAASFQTNYYVAGGGRTVDFPAGDILNPVYSTLNALTQSNQFPMIQNQSILLNPNNFYDAKLHITLPVVNMEIEYNRRMKRGLADLKQYELEIYQRELVKEIKLAYFKFLQSCNETEIYRNAQKIAVENERICKVLLVNDKLNRTGLLRAQSELQSISAKLSQAVLNSKSALEYLNFLINESLENQIVADFPDSIPSGVSQSEKLRVATSAELRQISSLAGVQKQAAALTRSFMIPRLNLFADLGSQGFNWKFNDRTAYYFAGLALQWDIFSSGKNSYKVKQSVIDQKLTEVTFNDTQNKLNLQLKFLQNNYEAELKIYQANQILAQTSQKYADDVQVLFKEGSAIFIELLDAQSQFLNAQLMLNISRFELWKIHAEVERVQSSYLFNK